MSFNLDDVNVGGQLKVGSGVVPAVGEGDKRVNGSVYVNGNQFINGDSGTRNALYVTGGSGPNSVYIDGDLYVTGSTDTGNKGRLASRFATADGLPPKAFDIEHPTK